MLVFQWFVWVLLCQDMVFSSQKSILHMLLKILLDILQVWLIIGWDKRIVHFFVYNQLAELLLDLLDSLYLGFYILLLLWGFRLWILQYLVLLWILCFLCWIDLLLWNHCFLCFQNLLFLLFVISFHILCLVWCLCSLQVYSKRFCLLQYWMLLE